MTQSLGHLQMFLDRRKEGRSELLQGVIIATLRVSFKKFNRLFVALNLILDIRAIKSRSLQHGELVEQIPAFCVHPIFGPGQILLLQSIRQLLVRRCVVVDHLLGELLDLVIARCPKRKVARLDLELTARFQVLGEAPQPL